MARASAGFAPLDATVEPRLRQAAEVIADRARANAAPWSRRIPPSVRIYQLTAGGRIATIAAGGARAPMAYTFEAPYGPVWHPVWGHGPRKDWHWVRQDPRPFLAPAGDEAADTAIDVFAEMIDDWEAASGFE